jgi:hypothetical protein
VRRALLAALLPLAASCAESAPSGPARLGAPTNPSLPPSAAPSPPTLIAGPVVRYKRDFGSQAFLLSLAPDSAFVIGYADGPSNAGWWPGRYERADSVIVFIFSGSSAMRELGARGILRGDTLIVRFNPLMQLNDFVDAEYIRVPGTP